MPRFARILILVGLVLVSPFTLRLQSRASEPLELTVFHSPLCSSCQEFSASILPGIQAGYGSALIVRSVDISTVDGLTELELAEAQAGSYSNPLPVLLVDGALLADEDLLALTAHLRQLLDARLGPPGEGLVYPAAVATASTSAGEICSADCVTTPPIHLAYLTKAYCEVCDRTRLMLSVVAQTYPQLVVHEFDQSEDARLLEAMGQHLDLPSERRLIAPSIYVGDRALVGEKSLTSEALREILESYAETGTQEFWTTIDTSTASLSILTRFRSLSVVAIVAAGLIDGVNPCAFATILFFVSYLTVSRRQRREMLLVGGAFALGVFATYFAVGLGAMRLLSVVQAARGLGAVIYGIMALICLVLGVLSIRDYFLARQGKLAEMSLNLPEKLRERIHLKIRAGRKAFWGAAFVTGAVISLLELACTVQVYLPTISYVISMPEMGMSGLAYLL
ncbi:MAG: hypothetical protein R6X16_17495, partial [Anaerolineae bacterium]